LLSLESGTKQSPLSTSLVHWLAPASSLKTQSHTPAALSIRDTTNSTRFNLRKKMMNGTIEKAAVELPNHKNKNGRSQARSTKGSVARTGAILMSCAGNFLMKPTEAAAIPEDLLKHAGQFDTAELTLAADKS